MLSPLRSLYGLVLAGWLLATAVHAQQRAVWLEPGPAGVLERVRGQLSDLGFLIEPVELAEPRTPAQLAATAGAHDVRAVLWAEPLEPLGFRLFVYEPAAARLLRRDFAAPDATPNGRSAALEALAVGARSALQAIAAGEAIGEAVGDGGSGSGSGSESGSGSGSGSGQRTADGGTRTADADADAAAAADAGTDPDSNHWWAALAAGYRLAGDGFGLSHGPGLAARGGFGPWALDLSYSAGLARELTLGSAVLELREHRVLGALQYGFALGARLRLVGGLGGGVLLLRRETARLPDTLRATAANTTADGLLQVGLAVRWVVAQTGRVALGVELEGAAVVLLAPLTLAVETPEGRESQSAWRVQPSLRLQLFVAWPHQPG